jgi:hypothetical protein
MESEEKNYIQYENVVAVFIPGLLQIENNQRIKGILFILAFALFLSLSILTRDISYTIFLLLYVYAFEVLDSFYIIIADKEKRRSGSAAALDEIDKGTIQKPQKPESFEAGEKFEKFVRERFDKDKFSIVKKTIPVDPNVYGPFVEANLDPDFIIRYRSNYEKFAVEAKFRYPNSTHDLIKPYQMTRYKQFEREEKIPVYIVIGYGGIPENPEKIFLVLLKHINSDELPIETLRDNTLSKYEMDRNNLFTWKPGSVWNSGYLELPDVQKSSSSS